MHFQGWVRIAFKSWIQPHGVIATNEPDCWALLRKWLERNRKRNRNDPEKIDMQGDGELVVLTAGCPPWTPCPPEEKEA